MTKCPQCGYSEVPELKVNNQIMNHYVTEDSKRTVVMNRAEEKFTTTVGVGKDEVKTNWVRKDIFDKMPPTPVKQPEPTKK